MKKYLTVMAAVFTLAMAAVSFGGATSADAETRYGNCYWSGTAPFCNGNCKPGFVARARQNCVTGSKLMCCERMGSSTQVYKPSKQYLARECREKCIKRGGVPYVCRARCAR